MATLADINHDSGPPVTNHWDTTDARFSITVAAALNGTVEGLQIDHGNTEFIRKGFVASTSQLNLSFYFDPNGAITPTTVNSTILHLGLSELIFTTNFASFLIKKKVTSGDIEVSMFRRDDTGAAVSVGTPFTITDNVHFFEIKITRALSDVASDGIYKYYVDSVLKHTESSRDNYDTFALIDSIFCYAGSQDAAMTGTIIYVDEVLLSDTSGFIGYDLVLGGGQP